jgi:hypothetical protein
MPNKLIKNHDLLIGNILSCPIIINSSDIFFLAQLHARFLSTFSILTSGGK